MSNRKTLIALLILAALSASAQLFAADLKAVKKIENLNRVAMEELDLGDAVAARKKLAEAVDAVKAAKLEQHGIAATTYIDLGIVETSAGGKDAAIAAFKRALEIDPAASLPAEFAKGEYAKAFGEAQAALVKKPEPPAPVAGIQHTPVDAAVEGAAIPIEAKLGADLKAKRVSLFYKLDGKDAFVLVAMKAGKDQTWRAEIPAGQTATSAIHYYIDARNAKAKVLASRGTASTPYTITIARLRKEAEAAVEAEEDDEEAPLKQFRKSR